MQTVTTSTSDGALAKKRKLDCSLSSDLKQRSTSVVTSSSTSAATKAPFIFNGLTTKKKKNNSSLYGLAIRRPTPSVVVASSPCLTAATAKPIKTICSSYHNQNEQFDTTSIMKPSTYMMKKLRESCHQNIQSRSSLSMPNGFFETITEKQIASYGQDIINAVRGRDINTLRHMWKNDGRSLNCCNKFGESILHMSCRRGFIDVVTFLLEEVQLSLYVVDDYGRTPLHDSMWTCQPDFELVSLLIQKAPELLLLSDKRGHLPLDYVRKEHYDKWITFINENNIMKTLIDSINKKQDNMKHFIESNNKSAMMMMTTTPSSPPIAQEKPSQVVLSSSCNTTVVQILKQHQQQQQQQQQQCQQNNINKVPSSLSSLPSSALLILQHYQQQQQHQKEQKKRLRNC